MNQRALKFKHALNTYILVLVSVYLKELVMNIQTEKLKLIEWLAGLTDETLVEKIRFLKEMQPTQVDWWEEISEAEKEAINQGLADAQSGKVTAHEEVRKRYEKWL